jgi:hypothetical protein
MHQAYLIHAVAEIKKMPQFMESYFSGSLKEYGHWSGGTVIIPIQPK